MGWIPEKAAKGLKELKALARRGADDDRRIFWNPEKAMLWCYCGHRSAIALFLVDDHEREMLPPYGCTMFISARGRVFVSGDAPPSPNGSYREMMDKAGAKMKSYEPMDPDMPMESYLEFIRESSQRRIKKTALLPFKHLSFDRVEFREHGLRLLKVNQYQIVLADKPFRCRLKEKNPETDISEILREIT